MTAKKELKRTGPFKPVDRAKRSREKLEREAGEEGRVADEPVERTQEVRKKGQAKKKSQ